MVVEKNAKVENAKVENAKIDITLIFAGYILLQFFSDSRFDMKSIKSEMLISYTKQAPN